MKRGLALLALLIPFLLPAQNQLKLEVKAKNVLKVKYSSSGEYLAIASGNKVDLYTAGSNTKVKTFMGHSKAVTSLAFNFQGGFLLTGSNDKSVRLWDISKNITVKTFTGHTKPVNSVAFSGDGQKIASVSDDMTLKVWGVESGELIYSKTDHTKSIKAVAISHDDKYVVTGGGDKKIIVYDLNSGEILQQLEGHQSWVRSLDISPDGKTLASGSEDKKLKIWNLEDGSLDREFIHKGWVVDVMFSGDGKYVGAAVDNKVGYFYNLKNGELSLKIDEGKNPLRALAFSPDGKDVSIVEDYSGSVKIYDVTSLGISPVFRFKDESDKASPQIFVSSPPNTQSGRVRFSKDLIDIKGTVIDESGVRRLRVNGIETPIRDNGNFIIKLPLTMGENFVTIEATDVNDNIALKKFVISRKGLDGEEYDPTTAKNYVFIVGINDYQYWPQLNNAVRDANDVASTLIGMYDFDFSDVTVLLDNQATRNNIYKTLRSYIERVTPKDNLMVYFSGHGHFDELLNEGYWVPYEARLDSDGDYLPNSSILKVLENIDSQHTFLVADACFSGSLFAEQQRGYVENVEKYKSRWGLASGRLETVSDGAYGDNSPFADAMIEFLKTNEKDRITVSELVQYVKMTVADQANQTPIGNPLKSLGDEGGEFVFYKK